MKHDFNNHDNKEPEYTSDDFLKTPEGREARLTLELHGLCVFIRKLSQKVRRRTLRDTKLRATSRR